MAENLPALDIMSAHAIDVLRAMEACERKHSGVVAALCNLHDDFQWFSPLPTGVETAIVAMLNSVLGDGMASWYLYDRPRGCGCIVEDDGTEWSIGSIDDLAAWAAARMAAKDR